jgi:enoyl-CoA hydratase/carnithine racemase
MKEFVSVDVADGVAIVTVDSPPVNAMSDAVLDGLERAADELAVNPDVRSVVLTGTGDRAFMAGADINEFRESLGDLEWLRQHTELTSRILDLWESLPQPVVAAVQASAIGGGLEMALVCDLIVADPAATFGLPEVRLGLIPGAGGTQRLPRRVPPALARELLLFGRLIGAEEALRAGLVNRVADSSAALAVACELARELAELPAVAVRAAKAAAAAALQGGLGDGLAKERELFFAVFGSEDVHEGFDAFLEKRAPNFLHR